MKNKIARFVTIFTSGFLLMLTISIFNDWTYEREMLTNLRDHVNSKIKKGDLTSFVDTALYYSHMLQDPATNIYSTKKFYSLKQYLAPSSFRNYYFGKDACGAYAAFFTRLVESAGYHAQIVQVNLSDRKNGHMAVCIFQNGKQYLVDPLMVYSFKDSTGHLSDINDVRKNWYSYYKLHTPPHYVQLYSYQYGWSYTNWYKFGSASQWLYRTLCKVIGKQKTDNFSFHHFMMGYNKYYLLSSLLGFIFTFIHALKLNFTHSIKEYINYRWGKATRKAA